MKKELEKRIKELKEAENYKWTTFAERDRITAKLERLEQLLDDMQGF